MANYHGDFIWYELITPDPDGARAFYQAVVGWQIEAAPSGPIDYRMIASDTGPVAGMMPLTPQMQEGGARPGWLGYVLVDDVDAMAGSITDGGGAVHMGPWDIPGVGRMALVADPQGAPFYIMKPTPPADQPDATSLSFSYDMPRPGHCAWNELSSADPAAALHFYGQRFGWVKDGEMDMGPLGKYEFLRHAGRAPDGSPPGHGMLGAVMPKMPEMPVSAWTFYFRVPDIDVAVAAITANGGSIVQPPTPIPGGDFSMVGVDPQGATFALVGSRA
ncbi:VOC family protein [Sphingomonas sp. MMS24-J45]|uniref:VOC family protein n=1 Tax=Sphingomonas sp. MMS24-J45 TaxID=3238806 RepID=UPI00384DC0DD